MSPIRKTRSARNIASRDSLSPEASNHLMIMDTVTDTSTSQPQREFWSGLEACEFLQEYGCSKIISYKQSLSSLDDIIETIGVSGSRTWKLIPQICAMECTIECNDFKRKHRAHCLFGLRSGKDGQVENPTVMYQLGYVAVEIIETDPPKHILRGLPYVLAVTVSKATGKAVGPAYLVFSQYADNMEDDMSRRTLRRPGDGLEERVRDIEPCLPFAWVHHVTDDFRDFGADYQVQFRADIPELGVSGRPEIVPVLLRDGYGSSFEVQEGGEEVVCERLMTDDEVEEYRLSLIPEDE